MASVVARDSPTSRHKPVSRGDSWSRVRGTGRFGAAAGQPSLDGSSDFVAGTFEITLTGTLTFSRG